MKISKLFHWLYASVMFLPLLIIPMFALWSINHDHNEPISVQKDVYEVVDYNQYLSADATYTEDYYFNFSTDSQLNFNYDLGYDSISLIDTHKYYFRITALTEQNSTGYFLLNGGSGIYILLPGSRVFSVEYTRNYSFTIVLNATEDTSLRYYRAYLGLFDLTQMFGLGNEPTAEEFETYFTNLYYSYNIGENIVISVGSDTLIYEDIGSQFLYTLYRSTNEYLNFDNVLSLGAISEWIELNVFNGNAPLVFTIVWHYLDYWLILSIFWLCFDVLIYVPQIAHRWLDKASLE